jgi:hypothetical protein
LHIVSNSTNGVGLQQLTAYRQPRSFRKKEDVEDLVNKITKEYPEGVKICRQYDDLVLSIMRREPIPPKYLADGTFTALKSYRQENENNRSAPSEISASDEERPLISDVMSKIVCDIIERNENCSQSVVS